ncbi:MAG: polysaccharide deacetylase family protein [Bacteroidales bacterium]
MILILVPEISPRLQYTAEVIFRYYCNTEYHLTVHEDEFTAYSGAKINYTPRFITGIPWLKPQGLLFENSINTISVQTAIYQQIPVLFPHDDERTVLPFDVFSAVFYLISRYEEYLPFSADQYGRFPATASLAFNCNFLNIPVVDHWINFLFPFISQRSFILNSTIDIDVAYAYRNKGLIRNTAGLVASALHGDLRTSAERLSVLSGLRSDPYDTYDYILSAHKKADLRPDFFILFSDYGPYDKNLSPKSRKFHKLIRQLDVAGNIGIHPSFASSRNLEKVGKEVERLSAVIGKPINKSRQHFLLVSLPKTYRALIQCGIQHDYSLGYADQPGFRAGTCTPFPFYDLADEKSTGLILHPFTLMEGTLKDYLDCSADEAKVIIQKLVGEVKKVEGTFVSVWHNESLSNQKRWKGWREVFEYMLDLCAINQMVN